MTQSVRCALNSLPRSNVMTVRLKAENFILETESWHKTGEVSIRLSVVGLCHVILVLIGDDMLTACAYLGWGYQRMWNLPLSPKLHC